MQAVRDLSQALAVPHEAALRIRDDVGFFQAVLAKRAPSSAQPEEEIDHEVRQIISQAVASEEVVDIFATAGLKGPDISVLSDELAFYDALETNDSAVQILPRRRDPMQYSSRVGRDRPQQRHHRLDTARERACEFTQVS